MPGAIRVGIGGWTFPDWRGGVFYPEGLPHAKELEFASRALTSIEINGTFYSTFKPASWRKWHDETPEGFVFSVKASQYCTNRKVLAEAGQAIERFHAQGLTELGAKLGPICWQFAKTKKFDAKDFAAFLKLLPRKRDGVALRHALEVRHTSFATAEFEGMARDHGAAIVYACGDPAFPEIDVRTAPFTYARILSTEESAPKGLSDKDIGGLAAQARTWAKGGDVFLYIISGAKARNPAAAMALIGKLAGGGRARSTRKKAAAR